MERRCSSIFIPVLPVDTLIRYQAALHFTPARDEQHEFNPLPQHLADEFGWPGIVDALARASARLTPEERRTGAIYTFNYGDAAALEFLGRGRELRRSSPGTTSTGCGACVDRRSIRCWSSAAR